MSIMTKQFPDNYFVEKYGLTATHSAVVAATPYLVGDKALDIGSGRGRNAVYLAQHGFKVDALDVNAAQLAVLDEIIETEGFESMISTELRDLNENPRIEGQYDVLVCTVVMMFLQPDTVAELLSQMQAATNPGGLNIIVCPMDTEAYPQQETFSFTFKEGELSKLYEGWELLVYNEDVGQMHRRGPDGNFLKFQFATMIAKKPA